MITTIKSIQHREDLVLVTDSQDTQPLRDAFQCDFDSFFVSIDDGEYKEVFGFYGIVPGLHRPATRH